jgi:hypothetical protein
MIVNIKTNSKNVKFYELAEGEYFAPSNSEVFSRDDIFIKVNAGSAFKLSENSASFYAFTGSFVVVKLKILEITAQEV